MDKTNKLLLKLVLKVSCIVLILSLISYFCLWIYTVNTLPEDLKQDYNENGLIDISDEQYQIIWFVLTGNKNYGFKWNIFLLDNFYKSKIERHISQILIGEKFKNKYRELRISKRFFMSFLEYGLSRYIKNDNNYKKCLSIIIKNSYMGNDIKGYEEACNVYYNENLKNVSPKELINIVFLSLSPAYKIGSLIYEEKINEIYYNYYK
jgi:hypothetical protein